MKALIVDDESYARSSLFFLLQEHCPQIQHIELADSVKAAVILLNSQSFHLVFLDIAMPNEDGFALLPYLNVAKTMVVFTTAYDRYAIKAIKASAVDYLLKPIDIDELIAAVQKVETLLLDHKNMNTTFAPLIENLDQLQLKKLTLPSTNGSKIVDIAQIIRIEADSNYSTFYFTQDATFTVAKSLKEFEDILPESTFFRIHKSHIVNLDYIKYYNKSSLELTLQNQHKVMVSRRRHSDFLEQLKKYSY